MAELHVLRVFCDAEWSFGNPLGVFLDGAEVPEERRQDVAAELGFSETVFVDDAAEGRIRIFTPGVRARLRRAPERRHRLAARQGARAGRGRCARPPARSRCGSTAAGPSSPRSRSGGRRWKFFQLRDATAVEEAPDLPDGEQRRLHLGLGRRGRGHGPLALLLPRRQHRRGRGHRLRGDLPGRGGRPRRSRSSRAAARASTRGRSATGRAEVGGRVVLDEVREFAL